MMAEEIQAARDRYRRDWQHHDVIYDRHQRPKEMLVEFESSVKELWESGGLPFLLHLCGGNEEQIIDIFREVQKGDWVFSTHRSHYHYLLAGGSEERLMEFILAGRSMFVFDHELNFITSSILAGTCCIAAGVAWSLKEQGSQNVVWCFLGDGAEEQGHFYEAVSFVAAHNLPCKFIIEDNDRSVDTPKSERRGGFEMQWPSCVMRYHYTPTYPHAGSGCQHHIEFKNIRPTNAYSNPLPQEAVDLINQNFWKLI